MAKNTSPLQRIVVMNRAGLKLTAIRHLLAWALPGSAGSEPCQELKDRVQATFVEVDHQITQLSESRKCLAALERLSTGWNHPVDKKLLSLSKEVERVPVEKVYRLFRNTV
jgi:DNA-binding transcriptional MerR regulator